MSSRLFFTVFLLVFFVGCSAPKVKLPDPNLNNTNSSFIEIQRSTSLARGAAYYRVFVDDNYIGQLMLGGKLRWRTKPGKSVILFKSYEAGIPTFSDEKINIDVELGYKYFVGFGHDFNGVFPVGGVYISSASTKISVKREVVQPNDQSAFF